MTGPIASQQAVTDAFRQFGNQEHRQGLWTTTTRPYVQGNRVGIEVDRCIMELDSTRGQERAGTEAYTTLNAKIAERPNDAGTIIDEFVDRRIVVKSEHVVPFTGPSRSELAGQKQGLKDALKGAYGL